MSLLRRLLVIATRTATPATTRLAQQQRHCCFTCSPRLLLHRSSPLRAASTSIGDGDVDEDTAKMSFPQKNGTAGERSPALPKVALSPSWRRDGIQPPWALPAAAAGTRHGQQHHPSKSSSSAIFPVPAVMEAADFVAFVHERVPLLVKRRVEQLANASRRTKSTSSPSEISQQNSDDQVAPASAAALQLYEEQAEREYAPLMHLDVKFVASIVYGKPSNSSTTGACGYDLKSDRLHVPLVPYRVAVALLLDLLPPKDADTAEAELRADEAARVHNVKVREEHKKRQESLTGGGKNTADEAVPAPHTLKPRPIPRCSLVQYTEYDRTVSVPAIRTGTPRVPVVALMGHIDHGKTTLLDRLQGSRLCDGEAGKITQTIRCFTVAATQNSNNLLLSRLGRVKEKHDEDEQVVPVSALGLGDRQQRGAAAYPQQITYVDTPGHRIFVEMRLAGHSVSDFLVLIIALDEGVKGQTLEVARVAMVTNKPLIIAFNKIDLFASSTAGSSASSQLDKALDEALGVLAHEGLKVRIVDSAAEVAAMASKKVPPKKTKKKLKKAKTMESTATATAATRESSAGVAVLLDRFMPCGDTTRLHAPEEQAERKQPSSDDDTADAQSREDKERVATENGKRQRHCFGVCISAKHGDRVQVLSDIVGVMARHRPPLAQYRSSRSSGRSTNAGGSAVGGGGGAQCVVVEASKQAVDPERPWIAGRRSARQYKQKNSNKAVAKIDHNATQKQMRPGGGFKPSSNVMVLTVLVRSGVLRVGTPFVADSSAGVVRMIRDYWGRPISEALPGMAAIIVDDRTAAGCPATRTHVLEMASAEAAATLVYYRKRLFWFVASFPRPETLRLLRPEGMQTAFHHVGDYGQLGKGHNSVEHKLIFGPSEQDRRQVAEGVREQGSLLGTDAGDNTIADDCDANGPAEVEAGDGESAVARTSEKAGVIEAIWSQLQPPQPQSDDEDDNDHHHIGDEQDDRGGKAAGPPDNVTVVGVLIKVDSVTTGRMLDREVARLGTANVVYHVNAVRFGKLNEDDMQICRDHCKLVICFRTPPCDNPIVSFQLERFGVCVIEHSIYSHLVSELKERAITMHRELYGALTAEEAKSERAFAESLVEKAVRLPLKKEASCSQFKVHQSLRAAASGADEGD